MPVRRANPEVSGVDPYRRLSASQVITWKNCPRLWYYSYIPKLKSPLPPQILRGNAVEDCISRILRESPVLLSPSDGNLISSPLNSDGSVSYDSEDGWACPGFEPRPKESWPKNRKELHDWALSRVDVHFDYCWNAAIKDWKSSPNRIGKSEDIDPEEGRQMIIAGIKLHLDQVELCLNANGGPYLESWRKGEFRPEWPAPDGFPKKWNMPHPGAEQELSPMSWIESWEISRPWFVDPDGSSFSETTCHPDDWFQGEYDLVYRWTGGIRIVDLKASVGKGDRSGGYLEQLRLYSWIWWETHDRTDEVEGLEIWYLGPGTIKEVPMPDELEMSTYNDELGQLYQKIHSKVPEITDCPPDPLPLRYFDIGGKPSNPAIDPDPKARCVRCNLRGVCENSDYELILPSLQRLEKFSHAWPITAMNNIKTRHTVIGDVSELNGPNLNSNGEIDLSFRLVDGYERAKVKVHRFGGLKDVSRSIQNESKVKIENALTSIWRSELVIDLDSKSIVSIAKDDESAPMIEVETRVNVVGRIWSINAFPDGKGVARWSITLVDSSGSVGVVAFKQFIPVIAAGLSRGDEIAILNGEIGEFAGQKQVRLGPGARVVLLKSSEDLDPF
ncbi:MAG: PD-(D/E)XK nuclease family protein [Candidatus Thalassarchaeaceae archaeon]|nr:PD-(D/E)XK nuclease family protein [Candidatus Thalassarchaeaceae archaeon]